MKLLFIRHGEPDYDNDCLTELGKKEALTVADRLEHEEIEAFFLSPLGRARETAVPTLARKHAEGTVYDWLQEFDAPIRRPDRPEKESICWDWLPQDWTTIDALYQPDQWYNVPEMKAGNVKAEYDRVAAGLDGILSRYGYEREGRFYRVKEPNTKTLCFFCHYGVSIVMISHLLSVSPMPLWHGIVAAPASVSALCTEERREGIATFRMNHYGDTSHIAAAGLPENVNARFTEIYSDMSQRHD